MQPANPTVPISKKRLWTGRILSAVAVLFMLFDGVIKLPPIAPVVESMGQLGFPASLARSIGVLELACVVLYLIPGTSVLGALLLTGYLGGATASQLRIGSPLFSHVLFPSYVGVLLWAGLFLTESRLGVLLGGGGSAEIRPAHD